MLCLAGGHFELGNAFFFINPAFLANVGNIAMHPFCKIIAFPVNYEVFNSLKICPFRNETESIHSAIEIKVKISSPGKKMPIN